MKEARNVGKKPLRVPLPGGRSLYLNPNQIGQVAARALEHPPLQKLIEAGEIEILGEGAKDLPHPTKAGSKTKGTRSSSRGRASGVPPSGDR